jgi:hypothetical protein
MSSFITICRHRLKNLQRAWLVADLAILAPALASCSHSARVCACVSFFLYVYGCSFWLVGQNFYAHAQFKGVLDKSD